jgi:hypothetical protein
MRRIVLIPSPTPDGKRVVLRAAYESPWERLRRFFSRRR